MVNNWSNYVRSWLFPPQCRLCLAPGENGLDICRACRLELPWLENTCRTCALPLPAGVSGQCSECLRKPPALDACHALFAYRPPVDDWIQALKFRQDLAVARLLGELLLRHPVVAGGTGGWRLLPVPLHPRRLRQRGYNQARELARPLLRAGYSTAACRCKRTRYTEAQTSLNRAQRGRNVRNAFSLPAQVAEEQLLLIDDVITTGATLNEMARALKRTGVRRVEAVLVARTVPRE